MTKSEVSSCRQNYRHSFYQMHDTVEFGPKECNNSYELASREERVALLKAGYTGKDIEFEYIRRNCMTIVGVNWQDRGFE